MSAATLDENGAPPMTELPPVWMRDFTVAPAPQTRGPDPPLWRQQQLGIPYVPANSLIGPPLDNSGDSETTALLVSQLVDDRRNTRGSDGRRVSFNTTK